MELQKSLTFQCESTSLHDWLGLNGFWTVHSTFAHDINTEITLWTNQCQTENGTPQPSDSDSFLIIAYCSECKTIEIYWREFISTVIGSGYVHEKENIIDKIKQVFWQKK